MCGIFGWSRNSSKPSDEVRTVAAVLAHANDDRGGHSWGYWGDGSIRKGLGRMADAQRKSIRALAGSRLAMAHTRFATHGAHTIANCHPFTIGGLIGAHNGIVYNHDWLNRHYLRDCQVDSMHLFYHLADGRSLADIEAYGAIQWVDAESPDGIYLARFHGGELAAARTRLGVFWSSDHRDLDRALAIEGLRAEWYDIEPDTIYSASGGMLYVLGPIDVGAPDRSKPLRRWNDGANPLAIEWKDGIADDEDLEPIDEFEAEWAAWRMSQ